MSGDYKKDIFLDLGIDDDGFRFSASVADALAQAESELAVLNGAREVL